MASDLLSGLGGLMKGLSGLMPQDDPAVQLMQAQGEVSELQKQEEALYAQIGRQAAERHGLEGFGETADRLRLVQSNLAAARAKLSSTKEAQAAREQAEKAAEEAARCPACGYENPEGTRFCNECGARLGTAVKRRCVSCGAELAPGTRFCGECGSRQPE